MRMHSLEHSKFAAGQRCRIDRRRKVKCVPLFSSILLLSSTALAWQADPNDGLNAKLGFTVQQYSLDTKSYLSGLLTIAKDFHLPMGIEWMKLPSGTALAYTHTWREVSVGAILQDVVNSQPGYQLDTTNGVAHIRLVSLRGDAGNILNVRVPEFEVQGEYVRVASRRLEHLANTIMVPPDPVMAAGGSGGSIATGSGDRRISFSVRGVTISEILDEMCLMSDLKVWIVCYPDSLTRTNNGFARTTTLMRDLTVDDRFQPTWVFLEWSAPPATS